MQSDFLNQKYKIEKSIKNLINRTYHFIIYYPQYDCTFNCIEHFWCNV